MAETVAKRGTLGQGSWVEGRQSHHLELGLGGAGRGEREAVPLATQLHPLSSQGLPPLNKLWATAHLRCLGAVLPVVGYSPSPLIGRDLVGSVGF